MHVFLLKLGSCEQFPLLVKGRLRFHLSTGFVEFFLEFGRAYTVSKVCMRAYSLFLVQLGEFGRVCSDFRICSSRQKTTVEGLGFKDHVLVSSSMIYFLLAISMEERCTERLEDLGVPY